MTASLTSRSLRSEIRRVEDLEPSEVLLMVELFRRHFHCAEAFEEDLAGKRWAVLLWEGRELVGFSSLGVSRCGLGSVYYSGDTLVLERARGNFGLAQAWAGHVFQQAALARGQEHWWFLICSGYRTYRYLPTFFQDFYPRHDRVTPEPIQGWLRSLAMRLYSGEYREGVIRLERPTALRAGKVPEGRLKDPHVNYFLRSNPGYAGGDELACLTRIHPDNLTRAGRRMLT